MNDLTDFSFEMSDIGRMFVYFFIFNYFSTQVFNIDFIHAAKNMWFFLYGKTSAVRQSIYTLWLFSTIAAKMLYLRLKMKFFHKPDIMGLSIEITQRDRNHLLVTYTYKGQTYSFITKLRRGPSSLGVVRCGDEDVSDVIKRFAGPGENYHGIVYTPRMLGFENPLVFMDLLGEETTYELDDPLIKVY